MNRFHKMLIILMTLAVIGIGMAIMINSGILDTSSVKNVVINHQNETESSSSSKKLVRSGISMKLQQKLFLTTNPLAQLLSVQLFQRMT